MTTPDNNPLHVIFKILKVDSRQGWDPTAVWLAVRGTGDVYDVAIGGYWRVNVPPLEWGTWVVGPVTNHGMATVNMPGDQVLKLPSTTNSPGLPDEARNTKSCMQFFRSGLSSPNGCTAP